MKKSLFIGFFKMPFFGRKICLKIPYKNYFIKYPINMYYFVSFSWKTVPKPPLPNFLLSSNVFLNHWSSLPYSLPFSISSIQPPQLKVPHLKSSTAQILYFAFFDLNSLFYLFSTKFSFLKNTKCKFKKYLNKIPYPEKLLKWWVQNQRYRNILRREIFLRKIFSLVQFLSG